MNHCLLARPDGCTCCNDYGDNSDCDVHIRCDYCRTPIGRVDWNTGIVTMWTKSCDCGLELRKGVRGSIVRVIAYLFGQLSLTDAPYLTDAEAYTFLDRLGGPR